MPQNDQTHELVKKAYGEVARKQTSCGCGQKATSGSCCDGNDYVVPDHPVPEAELGLSCGNPVAFGHINKGDVVLDLGSGAGKDVFLAAQKVGDAGRAIGVDMTPEMLRLARKNAVKFFQTTGLANVEFREGTIEDLPVDDASVDVVISNCVINLSTDKARVFREAYRVLKSGGRVVVSDIVLNRALPPELQKDASLYAACIAGALMREEYLDAVHQAGFKTVTVLSDRAYNLTSIGDSAVEEVSAKIAGSVASITVLAVK